MKYLIFFFFIIIICDSIFQFFIGKNILNLNLIDNRVSGIFGDELILGSYSLKSFLIIFDKSLKDLIIVFDIDDLYG